MTRMTRSVLAALPLLLAVALAGCGGDGGDDEVASANGNKTPAANASASSTLSADERNVKYAQCLREHGIDVDDPKPGQPGVRISFGPGGKGKMEKAQEACRKWNPQANASPGQQQKAQERQQKFAECMRENGVEDFPDPKPGQPIKIDKKLAEDPDFESAQKECQDVLAGQRGK